MSARLTVGCHLECFQAMHEKAYLAHTGPRGPAGWAWEGLLRTVFTIQSVSGKSGSQRSGYKGAHVGRQERRRQRGPQCEGRGRIRRL